MEENKEIEHVEEEKLSGRKKAAAVAVSCILIVSVMLCLGVVTQVLSNGYVNLCGFSLFRVVTGSMEPEISVGALLISKETDIEEIRVDDIVTFRSKESGMLGVIITHRVVAIHEGVNGAVLLETRGDANQYADGYFVDQGNLIGKAVYYTKSTNFFAGVLGMLTNKVGFLACIVLPCLLLGVVAMRDCVKNLMEEINAVNRELDKEEKAKNSVSLEQELSVEEYRELCERLKRELLEELRQSAEDDETKR